MKYKIASFDDYKFIELRFKRKKDGFDCDLEIENVNIELSVENYGSGSKRYFLNRLYKINLLINEFNDFHNAISNVDYLYNVEEIKNKPIKYSSRKFLNRSRGLATIQYDVRLRHEIYDDDCDDEHYLDINFVISDCNHTDYSDYEENIENRLEMKRILKRIKKLVTCLEEVKKEMIKAYNEEFNEKYKESTIRIKAKRKKKRIAV